MRAPTTKQQNHHDEDQATEPNTKQAERPACRPFRAVKRRTSQSPVMMVRTFIRVFFLFLIRIFTYRLYVQHLAHKLRNGVVKRQVIR